MMFHRIVNLCRGLLLFAVLAGPAFGQNKSIKLRNETIVTHPHGPQNPAANANAKARAAETANAEAKARPASGLFLVQFEGHLQPAWTAALRGLGVQLVRYVPDDAFVVHLKDTRPDQIEALPFVRWAGPYRPEHKIHDTVRKRAGQKPGEDLGVSVLLSPHADAAGVAEAKRSFRAVHSEAHSRFGAVLRGRVSPGQLNALAQSPNVLWIERAPEIKLYDEIASKIVAGDSGPGRTLAMQFGYDGRGVTVAVADSGLDTGDADTIHPDLAGRVDAFFFYGSLTDASDEHGHGTHCAGIIAGDGATGEVDESNALYGLGVAPRAHIVAQRVFDADGNFEAPPSYETLTRDAVRSGAEIGSNSWGDDTQGRYDISAMEFDGLVRDADQLSAGDQQYILEFSAGNAGAGAQTVGSPAVGKNVIATGASENDRVDFFLYADGPDAMADFSSRGPCEDGRIKPDVVAPGTWISSLRSVFANDDFAWAPISDRYMYEGGTSQAGPHVSGAAAVFVQYYRDQNTNRTPSPALVKAALINSAVDMDDAIETGPVPNMDEGWGRIFLPNVLLSSRPGRFFDQEALLQTGQTYERRVIIASSDEAFKVTLAYTDVPGFPAAIPALVNDLDLEVVAPDGTLYRGNQFQDGESVPNPASPDNINNVEAVHLLAPVPGEYLVRVRARNVVQDARQDTEDVDQDFALVLSGDIPQPGLGFVFLDRRAYTVPGNIQIKVIDSDQAGRPSVNVNLHSDSMPGGIALALRPSDSSGGFTGSVFTTISPVNGRLQILHGDTIEADYLDTSLGATRSASARADLLPPNLSSVGTTVQFGQTVVTWVTDEPATSVVIFGTTAALGQAVTNSVLTRTHSVGLQNLTPGTAYEFLVISSDEAGNTATNDNSGAHYRFVAPSAPTVLIVDNFNNDDFAFGPDIPLTTYTSTLDQIGISYDVWEMAGGGISPTYNDLKPYHAVLWRLSDNVFLSDTLSPAEQSAVQQYVAGGGGFFLASMEQLTRLSATFKHDLLQVGSFIEDDTAPAAVGVTGNPLTAGMNMALDYSYYQTESYEELGVPDDVSDTFTPTTNAAPILQDGFGAVIGLAYPKPGVAAGGRVVFLSIPLDAVPEGGAAPNNRATLMRNILNFLAPGEQGIGTIALNGTDFALPSLITIEVADSDLAGQGQFAVSITSTTESGPHQVVLSETTRRGVFQGSIALVSTHGAFPAGELRAVNGDAIVASYFDASSSRTLTATGRVDAIAPRISGVTSEPSYVDATIRWSTDEPADALVQYGESPLLGRSAYVAATGTSQEVFIGGLRPNHLYYYQVTSRDAAGNVTVDDNRGSFYVLQTLLPFSPPWLDDLEHGSGNWEVFTADESEGEWEYGTPQNELATSGHSGASAWGSNLHGQPVGYVESFLISPPIDLTSANNAVLQFYQNYDFTEGDADILHYGEVLIITNAAAAPVSIGDVTDFSSGWELATYDLKPYQGNLVYLVWHYVLFSFDNAPRGGWLIDDVSVTASTAVQGSIRITNNLWQAGWTLTGQTTRTGQGVNTLLTNLPPGTYSISFNNVPYYTTPAAQSGTLNANSTLLFGGNYTMVDVNHNGIPDSWEQQNFGEVSPNRTASTDTDHDGFTDAAEFAAGTNPTQTNSALRLSPPVVLGNGAKRLQWPTVVGHAYLVEGSSDGRTWVPLSGWMPATSTLTTFNPPTGPGSPYLFRLQVRP